MTKEELQELVKKYRNLSMKEESRDDDKSHLYERYADWVEDNIDIFGNLYDKEQLWETFLEDHDEDFDSMLPEGDDDDEITDYLTKD
ncbi:MAG: hypothetical protein Q8P34_16970 [Bacteroidota bacterium]|nr:hypothetical protein [Bacteroidota bacterium]